jgi:hypothetical protein
MKGRPVWRSWSCWSLVALACALQPLTATAEGLRLAVEVGGGVIGGDSLADVVPRLEVAAPRWSLGLGAPVRLRVHDAAPRDRCDTPAVRCADWDRRTDWGRLLRHLDLGQWQGPAHLHIGDLTGITLGHGSLVWRHYNNALFDTWRMGATGHLTWQRQGGSQPAGLSMLVGDIWRGDVMAARAWGRPLTAGRWQGLEVGIQAAIDRRGYAFVVQGDTLRGGGDDLEGSTVRRTVDAVGIDAALELARSDAAVLSVWTDAVLQPYRGLGLHGGLRGSLRGQHIDMALTLEGRLGSRGYVPALFGPLYELDRVWRQGQGDAAAVAGSRSSLEVARPGWGRLVLALDHVSGQRLDALAWLMTDDHARLSLRAFVAKRWIRRAIAVDGVSWGGDPLDWLAHVAARMQVSGPWYASLSGGRRWRVHETWTVGSAPLYAETEVRLAAGAEWRW